MEEAQERALQGPGPPQEDKDTPPTGSPTAPPGGAGTVRPLKWQRAWFKAKPGSSWHWLGWVLALSAGPMWLRPWPYLRADAVGTGVYEDDGL